MAKINKWKCLLWMSTDLGSVPKGKNWPLKVPICTVAWSSPLLSLPPPHLLAYPPHFMDILLIILHYHFQIVSIPLNWELLQALVYRTLWLFDPMLAPNPEHSQTKESSLNPVNMYYEVLHELTSSTLAAHTLYSNQSSALFSSLHKIWLPKALGPHTYQCHVPCSFLLIFLLLIC